MVLDRFHGYWNAGAVHLDRIVFRPIPDSTVRLVNLQTGQLDMLEELRRATPRRWRMTPS